MRTTIVKWGNSQGVRLPKYLLESADIDESDTLEILADNNAIIIRKIVHKVHKTIQERFKGFTESYDADIIAWGKPAGKEIW